MNPFLIGGIALTYVGGVVVTYVKGVSAYHYPNPVDAAREMPAVRTKVFKDALTWPKIVLTPFVGGAR